jgi:hypothetical protein
MIGMRQLVAQFLFGSASFKFVAVVLEPGTGFAQ